MKNKVTELVYILDRSGSMSGLESETIGGYNSMIKKQMEEDGAGNLLVSTVLFDNEVEVLHDRMPVDKIKPITDKEYYVRGCTALLDAIGSSINHIKKEHKNMNEEDVPEKVLFIITTDGMENASREYSYKKIKKMIEHQKEKKNWEFIFLGANIDAISVAESFGVSKNRAVRYECDSYGTSLNFNVMSNVISKARKCGSSKMMEDAFDKEEILESIQENYEKSNR